MDKPYVTPQAFADLSGISDELVRRYVKTGRLPHIKCGKAKVKIPVEAGLAALEAIAAETAANLAVGIPVQEPRVKPPGKKRGGRPPDKIRLAMKAR